jgi:hypothetical protein
LEDLVLEGRNPDRPGFRPISLRDVHPPHRRSTIAASRNQFTSMWWTQRQQADPGLVLRQFRYSFELG